MKKQIISFMLSLFLLILSLVIISVTVRISNNKILENDLFYKCRKAGGRFMAMSSTNTTFIWCEDEDFDDIFKTKIDFNITKPTN